MLKILSSNLHHNEQVLLNGILSLVIGADSVPLSPSLTLSHTLLVPSLTHKLLFISQVTTDFNCVVLIYPSFCLLQDILTKEITGHGTKRGGVYYMDDFGVGRTHHTQGDGRERLIWLWHR